MNVNVGTIFSIYRRKGDFSPGGVESVLQPGSCQLAAGYVLYGPSTVLVYTAGRGVFGFTLDPTIGAFVLSHEQMKMPAKGKYYSCNEANINLFPSIIALTSTRCGRRSRTPHIARATSVHWSQISTERC